MRGASSRKLAQSTQYYDKHKRAKTAVFHLQQDSNMCDKGQVACCGSSNFK